MYRFGKLSYNHWMVSYLIHLVEKEAKYNENNVGPIVETDKKSWKKYLDIALALLEASIKKAKATAQKNLPKPIELATVSESMKCLAKSKKARTAEVPLDIVTSSFNEAQGKGTNQIKDQFKKKDKGKAKDTNRVTQSAMTSESGSQFDLPDSSEYELRSLHSVIRAAESTSEVITVPNIYWNDVLTSQIIVYWDPVEQTFGCYLGYLSNTLYPYGAKGPSPRHYKVKYWSLLFVRDYDKGDSMIHIYKVYWLLNFPETPHKLKEWPTGI
ncbi:uncharacterized protein EDB93DRAFT_1101872 [Suillus bovinus]|uniref:uncharacterized protein n=1 Tax=Suillus bovinus TaxID=48563 RepID=UPI001B86ED31|nr:uncharacterized protein EDB93DRAFT_1101872 [Suillus bovinus]KAG2155306.1 hypothetical protein EDB93DRAFT_1101872 [Suillus bovinus]